MSQYCTMPTRERKMHAAAICREVQGGDANGDTMDLGKKLSTPKDIMLEELSLLSNRGSRLFKMRQRRSEKYTFESIQNETNMQLNNDLENTEITEDGGKTPPNTPALGNPPNPENIAPGYGGPLQDVPAEKFNSTAVPKSYHSPWEQAIINDPALAETLNLKMPAPEPRPEGPDYKSFNRVATPFGGFDKAPRGITFKLPELDLNAPKYPELQDPGIKRPTFNRTALGWISDGSPIILPIVPLEPMIIPESDDL
ncbi:myozenin-2b isoform X1 [Osmerus eperlanus]|uniref:myozenin-2b isoform X1 n=2 Tax=Osmerus eperlanus TaxID=29151 RepID=UPI002E15DE52